jgi:phospholipid-translocating ATPase
VSVEGVFGAEGENGDGKYIRHYEVLAINGFDPTRKRMSIVVRDNRNGQIILFCKGADNKMVEILTGGVDGEQKIAIDKLNSHLDGFARTGLRTLVMGKRVLSEEEFNEWSNEYDEARTSVSDRDEKLMECAISIEKDITLIGASAIEDKLQDGVPEAIKALRSSGVAVWVLTGDKAETAKNIGIACQVSFILLSHLRTLLKNSTVFDLAHL